MPATDQYDLFSKSLAQYTRSIGHPARIAVLMALAAHSDGPIHNIIEIPGLSKSTVLQHLRELKRAGLIQGNLYGSKTQYSIDMTKINEFDAKFKDFMITLRNPNP